VAITATIHHKHTKHIHLAYNTSRILDDEIADSSKNAIINQDNGVHHYQSGQKSNYSLLSDLDNNFII